MEIRGSVAIVTGSSRGIGRATASMLADAGSKVVLNARKKTEALLAVADALGPPSRVHYAAAKSALLGLTRALGLEMAGTGVRVAGVAPGLTDTEIVRQGLPNLSERVARVPLGRMATADEVAHAVRFVVENEFMTAETVFVSGGE